MDTKRWQRICEVFDAVVDAPQDERAEVLKCLCAGDAELRREVEALLAADIRANTFEHYADSARGGMAADWADAADESADESADEFAYKRVGPWRLLREIGRGGMGVVYLAERADGAFEQNAALKLVKRGMDSDAVLARFLRERQILARLQHPHIAHLIDGGFVADGRPYFAMEYVEGKPLLVHCAALHANLRERLELFLDVCAAVQFAHGQLIVHRDIKPSNILVTAAGDAKLLDFGIAKLLDDSQGGTIDAQQRPMTPAFAAPEQLRGEPVTTATDIYALGAVLYELLSGARALASANATTPEAALRMLEAGVLAPPSRAAGMDAPLPPRLLRGDLDTIVLKALQRDPQRRYATAEALAGDLRRFLAGQPIAARRDRAGYRLRKFVGRHRLGVAASTLAVLALIAALSFAVWQAREKARQATVSDRVTQFLIGLFSGADPEHTRGASVTAQDLLDAGTQRLHADTQVAPDVRARLLQTVATTYTDLGLYDRALPLAQQALALLRRDPAQANADIAASLDQIGNLLRLKADYAQAEPLLRNALAMRRALLPVDDPAIIESLDHVAALDSAKGDFKGADAALAQALAAAQRHYGEGATETARYIDDYASNLDDMGKRTEALKIYRQALAIREKNLGPDDAEVATSLLNLGSHLDASGDYAAAAPLLERALAIRAKVYGPHHPLTGFAQLALAGVYQDLSRFDDEEKQARSALAIFRASLPPEHPQITDALNLLATTAMSRRNFTDSIPLAQEVLARSRKALGDTHPDTLTAKNNLAYALYHAGRYADAEVLQREVIAQVGADNGQGVDATDCENLANTLMKQGKFAEAISYEQRAVAIQTQREGEVSGNTAVALVGLAVAEELAGTNADAERDFRAALAVGEKLHASHDIDLFQWRLPLADFLVGRERCAEAEPLLDAIVTELKPREPLRDPLALLETQLLQGQCLIAAKHKAQGEVLQNDARVQLRKMPGIEVDLYATTARLLAAHGKN
ncbi:MAG: serine/threonine protein kinase [Proteobacteria bacterium]|nr:serine/threonine protein kinase [Pseudomonadota bacterium]